jgi:tetratricopeptide (TPR) repeat protein
MDDQVPNTHYLLGYNYNALLQYDKAISQFEKALEIYDKWKSKPWWVRNYTYLGLEYIKTGQYRKAKKLYKKAEQDFPDDPEIIYGKVILSFAKRDSNAANEYTEKYISILNNNSSSEAEITTSLAGMYSEAGIMNKAEGYYRKALSLEPAKSLIMNDVAYFLIDRDLNLNEGMELVNKALELNPEDYNFMYTKGWGLFKQGKYQEAFETLQKSWNIRREKAIYNHEAYLHLEAAKKAVASQKN